VREALIHTPALAYRHAEAWGKIFAAKPLRPRGDWGRSAQGGDRAPVSTRTDTSADPNFANWLLDVARSRRGPYFYIVDEKWTVLYFHPHPEFSSEDGRFPLDLLPAAKALRDMPDVDRTTDTAVILLRNNLALRLLPVDSTGQTVFAFFLEPFHTRDLVATSAKWFRLTARESDVLDRILCGAGTADIAQQLCIAETTVQDHVTNIARKMGVTKRKEIVSAVLDVTSRLRRP
jgi:DNA-binding CsgD family transcriptional regulator